jgi:RNA polymerase sigma-70 factor (ECF subfamily)
VIGPQTSDSEPDASAALVKRIIAGDPTAEEELARRYTRGIRMLLRRITNDRSADDLHQDTFRRALEKIRRGELREPGKLSAFMCGLARNLAIDSLRQSMRAEQLQPPQPVPTPDADALEQLLREERARAVRQVLSEMPVARDREILRRFYIAEEDKEQICADLGLSALHFNRVLHRARERFRELFDRMTLG